MKYGIFAAIILFLASCSNQETEDSIRDQISTYKKDVYTLNQKITELEKKLKVMNSGDNSMDKIPVEVLALSYEPFNHYIKVSGTAEAVKEAFISPEVGGQIREIYVKEGDYVERGQLLAKLNTEITESSIADMKSALELAEIVYEKQERLWEKGIGSEIQYLNAKNNKESLEQKLVSLQAQLDMAIIKAPVSGIVDKINSKRGELAMPGMQLMQIVNLEEMYINADISESYLGQVHEGEIVKVEFPVYPEMSLDLPIYRKGNVINPNNRTFTVQLKLKNADRLLKPNILSILHINDFSADSAIVIPSAIIKQDITGSYIYTMQQTDGKWLAKKIYVTPGKSYLDKTMVVTGLQPGQQVIVQGYNMVSDGSEVYVNSGNES
jgi:RND family efflux transporter MFP subunit